MLAGLSKSPVELTTFIQFSHITSVSVDIPFLKVMRIAVKLHEQGCLEESTLASEIFAIAGGGKYSVDEVHILLRALQNPSKLPVTWAIVFIEVAITTEGIDLQLVFNFWKALNRDRKETIWLRFMHFHKSERYQGIITDLLKFNSDEAFDLAAHIVSRCPEVMPEISAEMNRRAASKLLVGGLSEARKSTLFRCLLHSKPTLEEAKLYGECHVFNALLHSSLYSKSQIVDRLNVMPQSLKKDEFSSLRIELKRLLSCKEDYPPEISAAALDALIQLDIASISPITDTIWQKSS